MRRLRLALVGFGNVGRRFTSLLEGSYKSAFSKRGLEVCVTGIATAHHGSAIDPRGLALRTCRTRVSGGGGLEGLHRGRPLASVEEFIETVPTDILLELTPLDPRSGEPAISYIRRALGRGLSVVTANKGPVAFARRALKALAERRGVSFRHEGAVMDGVPVFNLWERCLPGNRVLSFAGTLNSTTSHILSRVASGASPTRALREAQAMGIAEADASNDLEGWDSAVKGCALANALMGASVRPRDVARRGIGGLTPGRLRRDFRRGIRWRLVVRGSRLGRGVRVKVSPEPLAPGDPLAGSGADSTLLLETSLLGEIGILERGGTVEQTAYALLSDILLSQEDRGGR